MRCQPLVPTTSCKIALVGEAPGEQEAKQGIPFVGASGRELIRMCHTAGIPFQECLVTNVFMERPPANDIGMYCVKKSDLPKDYSWPALAPGKYVHPLYLAEVTHRLKNELEAFDPNVIVPLGATALWAVCGYSGIGKFRGAVQPSRLLPGKKVVPTWHPANILRNWSNRVVCILDLMKAKREAEYPEIRIQRREVWLEPTIRDLWDFYDQYLIHAPIRSVDIETDRGDLISCIGIAPSDDRCLVVPFLDRRKPGYSYWQTQADELRAWKFIHHVLCSDPRFTVLGQNFLYDLTYMAEIELLPLGYRRDSMLKHHAYEPELAKSLQFMGSIYADELVWKQMRPKRRGKKGQVEKRED